MEHKTHHTTDLDHVKDSLTKLRDDFSGLYDAALELGKNAPGEVKDKLEEGLKQLQRMKKTVRANGTHAVEVIQDKVAERPFTSIAVVFGVGLLCGALLKRR